MENPDGPEGLANVATAIAGVSPRCGLLVILGGDNAATYAAMTAVAAGGLSSWSLLTFDAHLDLRDGWSNGSPVRQLLDAGLPGANIVQVGLADFSNSADYATRARDAGIHAVPRSTLHHRPMEQVVADALALAGDGGRPIYVDIDLDVCDQAAVPGCPAAAPGGLSAHQLRCAVRLLASDPWVKAIDFTEVDVERDAPDGRTVRLMALLVLEALAGFARRTT